MLCKIADLIVEVPAAGDLVSRCQGYLCESKSGADITIRTELFNSSNWPGVSENQIIYMESGFQFAGYLLNFDGLRLHASAVAWNNRAYLFSAPCGTGKSTHTRLWQQLYGRDAQVINDDKPALRRLDDVWYAYGTPWCGKDGINQNKKVPLGAICFLVQAPHNRIRRLNQQEAAQRIISQTLHRFKRVETLDLMLSLVNKLVEEIPVFELENKPEEDAAILSSTIMRAAVEESML